MGSLKRWLKRLFDDIQFIARYKPGDPVPRSASLYRVARCERRCLEFVYILNLLAGMCAGACISARLFLLYDDHFFSNSFNPTSIISAIVPVLTFAFLMCLGATASFHYAKWLLGNQVQSCYLIEAHLGRPIGGDSFGSGPSAPTSSSGDGDGLRCTARDSRYDDGGGWGFVPSFAAA